MMHLRASRIYESRAARFCAVGVINTAFSYGVFALLTFISDHHDINLLVSTAFGIIFAFRYSKKFVFRSQRPGRFVPFVMNYGFALLINLVVFNVLLMGGFSALEAQAVSIPIVIAVSYVINATIVFSPEL